MNVGAFAQNGCTGGSALATRRSTGKHCVTWCTLSTHFLDNVIDANNYPLPEISDLGQRIRRIGLGVMGYADLLVRIGVPYNSAEGIEVGNQLMSVRR